MQKKGFTLLEILLVVAAIGILAGIVILALNPSKQLGDTRDARRWSDVNTMMNAVYQYSVDHDGTLPSGIDTVTGTYQVFGTDSGTCDTTCGSLSTDEDCVDLDSSLVPTYVVGIPFDPTTGDAGNTDYYINKDADDRIVVGACDPEQETEIEVSR